MDKITIKIEITSQIEELLEYVKTRGYQEVIYTEKGAESNPESPFEFAQRFMENLLEQDFASMKICEISNNFEVQKQEAIKLVREEIKNNHIKSELILFNNAGEIILTQKQMQKLGEINNITETKNMPNLLHKIAKVIWG